MWRILMRSYLPSSLAVVVALVATVTPALAWHVGTPQSSDGLARNIPFRAAVVWDLGYAAQLIVGCLPSGSYTVMIVFPRLKPFHLPAVQEGNITIWDGDATLWSSSTEPVTSFTLEEIVLPTRRSYGIVELLKAMATPATDLSVSFTGIFSWDVHAHPGKSDLDAANVARLGDLCPGKINATDAP